MKKISICAAVLFAVLSFILTGPASALSCAQPRPPQDEMNYSEAVFKGTLVAQSNNKLFFEVSKVWKGEVSRKFTLHQNFWTSFQEGQEYIVFAAPEDGRLRPRLCGNTGPAAGIDEQALGAEIPLAPDARIPGAWIVWTAIGALIVLAFILIRRMIRTPGDSA